MSQYRCESCSIYCECKIPDECDFVPAVCLGQFKTTDETCDWEKIDDELTK